MVKPKRFGGAAYQPKNLGAEPAAPAVTSTGGAATDSSLPKGDARTTDAATLAALKTIKVPYSSRLSAAADRQLKELGKRGGHSQVDLLAEAVNLLFKKHGLDELA
jgi:hypothetical protein